MRTLFKLFSILLFALCLAACGDKQEKQISAVIPLVDSKPNSALAILSKIDQTKLSDKDLALYSLIYTMAQDKSGIDVDNDSLLRNAYNWYHDKPKDWLYAKSEYYMGKYYSLNDSSEKALDCFSKSMVAAKQQKDYYTQCMAMFQSSRIFKEHDSNLAVHYAKDAIDISKTLRNIPIIDKVYGLLNLAECLIECYNDYGVKDYLEEGKTWAGKALVLAKQSMDSTAIADAYQDMSVFYRYEKNDSATLAAQTSFAYQPVKDVAAVFSLSESLYQVDSLQKAKSLLLGIPIKEREIYGTEIYDLLRLIALKENDCIKVSQYADSAELYLEHNNNINFEKKDRYNLLLTRKEIQNAEYKSNLRWKTRIIIIVILLSSIIIICVVCLYRQRQNRIMKDIELEREQHQAELDHKETQILTMRNFLMRKVDIINKIRSLTNNNEKILLSDDDWEEIAVFLNNTDNDFISRLKEDFPNLTKKDIRFLMLIKIGLPYPVIAQIYSIEPKSVKQKLFLIKDKLDLKNSQKSAKEFIESY